MVIMQISLVKAAPSRLVTGTLCLLGKRLEPRRNHFYVKSTDLIGGSERLFTGSGRLLILGAPLLNGGHNYAVCLGVDCLSWEQGLSGAEWRTEPRPSPQTPGPGFLLSTEFSLLFSSLRFNLVLRYWLLCWFLGCGPDPAFILDLCTFGHLSPSCACHYPYFWRLCNDFWTG